MTIKQIIHRSILIYIICMLIAQCSMAQSVTETFSSSAPSSATWSSTSSSWNFSYDATATGNSRTGNYSARLSSASTGNGKYIYIQTTVQSGYLYTFTFWSKRVCDVTIITNETADQATPLLTTSLSNSSCASNFSTWYSWTANYTATYTGTIYFQILATTVYGGPTSIYIDDVSITGASALPITLLSFNGYANFDGVTLDWKTGSEYNNYYFSLYRSRDIKNWYLIGTVPSKGNSADIQEYTFTELDSPYGLSYYQLKQTDRDGTYVYFDPIAVFNNRTYKTVYRCIDLLGRDVDINTGQVRIVVYTDGSKELVIGNNF